MGRLLRATAFGLAKGRFRAAFETALIAAPSACGLLLTKKEKTHFLKVVVSTKSLLRQYRLFYCGRWFCIKVLKQPYF